MIQHKVIVAGCGGMSNTWLDYAEQRSNVKIVGLVDIFEENAIKMSQKRNLNVPTYTNLEKAIKDTGANLVFDVTIPASHKEIVTTAFKSGCNVFGEKPMAESISDAEEIIQLSKEVDRSYSVMQNRRFIRNIRSIRNFLQTETIGKVGSIHADFFLGPHFGGFRDVMAHPLIVDMAIHTFDQARFLIGADPVSVYCHEYNPHGSWYKGNASAICIFEMSDGSTFSYNGSWCAEGFNTSWESEWRITGSKGTVKWDGAHFPQCEVVDTEKPAEFLRKVQKGEIPVVCEGNEGHFGCLDEMFTALEENRLAETDCTDNIKSMMMVFGSMESARSGQKVYLKDLYSI